MRKSGQAGRDDGYDVAERRYLRIRQLARYSRERRLAEAAKGDANDALWAIEAIRDYNPEPDPDKIKAKVLLINAAEDHANPAELGTVERDEATQAWRVCANPRRTQYPRPFQPFLCRAVEALSDRVHEDSGPAARSRSRINPQYQHGQAR